MINIAFQIQHDLKYRKLPLLIIFLIFFWMIWNKCHSQEFQTFNRPESELRLISTAPGSQIWMTEKQIFALYEKRINFVDITDGHLQFEQQVPRKQQNFPKKAREEKLVKEILKEVSSEKLKSFLEKFTSFHTRYCIESYKFR